MRAALGSALTLVLAASSSQTLICHVAPALIHVCVIFDTRP